LTAYRKHQYFQKETSTFAMFDKLKRIFIIEEEGEKKVTASEKPNIAEKQASNIEEVVPSVGSKSTSSKIQGTPKDKFTSILFGAIEANDIEGFDYLEYKESLQSLAKMNMDEATRYKSAFAMAQTMGATPQKLIDSVTHYRNVLAKEEAKFAQALESQKVKQIHEEEKKIVQLQKNIQARQQQIEEIQKQIAEDEKHLIKTQKGLEGAAAKINATKANFMASYRLIAGQLETDIEKIKTYLK